MPLTSVKAEEPKSSTLSDTSYEYSKITDYWLDSSYYLDGTTFYGPSGAGPATLILEKSKSSQIVQTASVSGNITSSELYSISSQFGVTIGETDTKRVSYSITIPAGEKRQIIIKPIYIRYAVEISSYSRYLSHDYFNGSKIVYLNIFQDFEYSWRNV